MLFFFLVLMLEQLLEHTPKQEQKAKEYHTLPALKIVLDWLRIESHLLAHPILKNSVLV